MQSKWQPKTQTGHLHGEIRFPRFLTHPMLNICQTPDSQFILRYSHGNEFARPEGETMITAARSTFASGVAFVGASAIALNPATSAAEKDKSSAGAAGNARSAAGKAPGGGNGHSRSHGSASNS
jgi:hypothetical protein